MTRCGRAGRRLTVFLAAATFLTALVLGSTAGTAAAHPLGNYSVNSHSGIVVTPSGIDISFVLDLAEIPTFQQRTAIDSDRDGGVDRDERAAFERKQCALIADNLHLSVAGRQVLLEARRSSVSFPSGQAGLATTRLRCELHAHAVLGRQGTTITYRNEAFAERVGWHEITAVGDRATITRSSVPDESVSEVLRRYPENMLQSPLRQRTATLAAEPGGPALARSRSGAQERSVALPDGLDRATRAFSSFIALHELTLGVAAVAILLSILLGAIHALAPGHGKTVMAAYLIGQRGTFAQAGAVALTVTATHTLGVLVLGIAISTSAVVAPERLYPYLTLVSGLMLAAIGASILTNPRRARRRAARLARDAGEGSPDMRLEGEADENHLEAHPHSARDRHRHPHHADVGHHAAPTAGVLETAPGRAGRASPRDTSPTTRDVSRPVVGPVHSHYGGHPHHGPLPPGQGWSWGNLLAMGLVGGLLPSPSAVVVLLGAIALGRPWFGVVVVVAYGLGMATTLTGAGLVLVRTRHALDRRLLTSPRWNRLHALNRLVPLATGLVIVAVGIGLSVQAALKL